MQYVTKRTRGTTEGDVGPSSSLGKGYDVEDTKNGFDNVIRGLSRKRWFSIQRLNRRFDGLPQRI